MQVIFFLNCFFSLKQPQRNLIRYKLLSINTQENPLQFCSLLAVGSQKQYHPHVHGS